MSNKERYFTHENIHQKSLEMVDSIYSKVRNRNLKPDTRRTALLVLDMQNYFLDEKSHAYIPATDAIIDNINKLVISSRKKDIPVFFTRHINDESDSGNMGKWWNDIIRQNDPGSQLSDKLETYGEIIIKSQYDAFYKTELEHKLLSYGISDILITGVMANLCCETSARSAFVHGFRPFFIVDCTAAYTYKLHYGSCLNIAHGFGQLVGSWEIMR